MSGSSYAAELALLWRDARLRWVSAILLLSLIATFAAGLRESERYAAESRRITEVERARWLHQDPKDPHSADHFGLWVFKPAAPLATLEPGIDPYVGRMIRIEAHIFNDAIFRSSQDATPLARAGGTNVSDIVQLIVPLLVILLGFASFAADRERGTLRMALGNGVQPLRLMLGRFAALLTVVTLVVGLPLLMLGTIAIVSLDAASAQAFARLGLWVLVQLLYAAVFLALVMTVSLAARTAQQALAVSLLGWVVICVVIPRAAALGVDSIEPHPSYQEARARIDAQVKEFNTAEANHGRESELLKRFQVTTIDELPVDMRGTLMDERETHTHAVLDRELGGFFAKLKRREWLYGLAGLLSPRAALQTLSASLAGTDYARHIDFVNVSESYRRNLSRTMNGELIRNPQRGGTRYVAAQSTWELVPKYSYLPASLLRSLREAAWPLSLLILWAGVSAWIALRLARQVMP